MKYGQEVPRSWIPDFNVTHTQEPDISKIRPTDQPSPKDPQDLKTYYDLKRRGRMIRQRQQIIKANQAIRSIQLMLAAAIVLLSSLAGGWLGLGLGAIAALSLVLLRIEL